MGKRNGYLKQEDLIYSRIYGRNRYKFKGESIQNPLGGAGKKGQLTPLLENIITGEQFYCKRIRGTQDYIESYYRAMILNPPAYQNISWPMDMVMMSCEEVEACEVFVESVYCEENKEPNEYVEYVLLFPYIGEIPWKSVAKTLENQKEHGWQNPAIRAMALSILQAVESLNRCGYSYHDIHLSRFFLMPDGQVYLEFSPLIYAMDDMASCATDVCDVTWGAYPLEFADPFIVQRFLEHKSAKLDMRSQNYSLCALLFYLFFARYAYDGRLLAEDSGSTMYQYYAKFLNYHKMPVFIFDPNDTCNCIGIFDDEQAVIKRWQQCPGELRQLLSDVLIEKNALRKEQSLCPTPSMWLDYIPKIQWDQNSASSGGNV